MLTVLQKNNFIFSKLIILLLTGMVLLFYPVLAMAEDYEDYLELDMEALMEIEVVSASRRPQKISEAPNAIYVITAEDIKRSGAVDLPDLFRGVPGLNVISMYGSSFGISGRGLNSAFGRGGLLVMIDGRSLYSSFFGGTFWENEEIFLEDIRQIEIISGTGATIWGGNAVSGVINIITKDPEEDQGIMISGKAGTEKLRGTVASYADTIDKLSFRLTGGYWENEGFRGAHDYRRIPKATAKAKYKLSNNSVVYFSGGINRAQIGLDLTQFTKRTGSDFRSHYQMLRWEHEFSKDSQLILQTYHSTFQINSYDKEVRARENKIVIDVQHSFKLGDRHKVVWGFDYQKLGTESKLLTPESPDDDVVEFFVQEEVKIFDNVSIVGGVRATKTHRRDWELSPRFCVLYSPHDNHQFRFAYSRAYKTPSFGAQYMDIKPFPFVVMQGDRDLSTEQMTSFELGYRTSFFHEVGINVELYYNRFERALGVPVTSFFPVVIEWDNYYDIDLKGIEVSFDYPVTNWWRLKANYAYQGSDQNNTPKHKFNLSSSFTFKNGILLDIKTYYVDDTDWGDTDIDGYTRLDVRIAKKFFNGKVELSVVGQNVSDKYHSESVVVGDTANRVERTVYGQATLWFR